MKVSKETHLKLAFFLWGLVGTGLLVAGGVFLFGDRSLSILKAGQASSGLAEWGGLAVALAVGFIKGRFVLTKIALKYMSRIDHLPDESPVYMTFSLKSWTLILLMIAIGRTIRFLGAPHLIIGTVYIAVGFALVLGSRTYLTGPP
ncbi:MAG: hypothetical protein ACE5HN_11025 [Nitrospiria bacterium]